MSFQLSIRFLLFAMLFVLDVFGASLSYLPEETTVQQSLKNISQPLQINPEKSGSSVSSPVKLNSVQSVGDSTNGIKIEQTSSNSTQNETRKYQNFKGEQSDLLKCCISIPFDDDDDEEPTVIPEQTTRMNHSELEASSVVQNGNLSKSNKSGFSSKNAPKTTKETDGELNRTIYITVSAEVSDANTNSTDSLGIKSNYTKSPSSNVLPEVIRGDQYARLDTEDEKKSAKVNESKSSTISIIVLVTATTFAAILATSYVAMIIKRYYLQSRYGHRELLVNDIEFVTNDLRHFEL